MKDVFVLVLFLSASELHIIASCFLVLCHAYYVTPCLVATTHVVR